MQRKVRKKISKGGILKGSAILVLGGFLFGFAFQNCSQVSVNDMTIAAKEELARIARIGASEETVTVGINEVPQLKLFFSVDNSGTMYRNQLNLAESFAAMFDQNSSDSLSKFDATIRLTNTAQKSPMLQDANGIDTLNQISKQQLDASAAVLPTISETDYVRNVRTAAQNIGRLAGDNLGFQIEKSMSPLTYNFQPAFVKGISFTDADVANIQDAIRKPAGVSGEAIVEDFKNRVEVLNNQRIPILTTLVNNKYQIEHADIVDNESGLCSVARILRNPDQYINSGELAAFTIVSDENDADADGRRCIQSIKKLVGTESLVDGKCFKSTTSLTGSYLQSTNGADNCNVFGKKSATFKFDYAQYITSIQYRTKISDEVSTWSLPKVSLTYGIRDTTKPPSCTGIRSTSIRYPVLKSAETKQVSYTQLTYTQKVPTYATKKTKVKFWFERCYDVASDGGITRNICTLEQAMQTADVLGYQGPTGSAACLAAAQARVAARSEPAAKLVNTTANPVTCENFEEPTLVVCSPTSNSNCVVGEKTEPKIVSPNFAGDHTAQAACVALAQSQPGYVAAPAPSCVSKNLQNLANCDGHPTAANCRMHTAAQYDYVSTSLSNAPVVQADISSSDCKAQAATRFATGAKPYAMAGEANYPTQCQTKIESTTAVCTTDQAQRGGLTALQGYKSNTVPVDGKDFTTSYCATVASGRSDYVAPATSGITPSCVNGQAATVASCTDAQKAPAIGCTRTFYRAAEYADRGGQHIAYDRALSTPTACFNYVRDSVSDAKKSISSTADVECTVTRSPSVIRSRTVEVSFKDITAASLDDGMILPVKDASCGVYKNLAFSKLTGNTDGFVVAEDNCTISSINDASNTPVSMTGAKSCATIASEKCALTGDRACGGTTTPTSATVSTVNKPYAANERLTCATLCKDSKTNFCKGLQDTNADATILSYIQTDMARPSATCVAAPYVNVTSSAYTKNQVDDTKKAVACEAEAITGIPFYFEEASPRRVYNTEAIVTEYVSGTDDAGNPINLVDYIKARSQQLAGGQMIFSALVQIPDDLSPTGTGSVGEHYQRLISETGGQLGSVFSPDYSVALRDLGRVIKENLIRSMTLRTMRADQIIKQVFKVGADGQESQIAQDLWTQNGVTLVFSKKLEISEGDRFIVKFQNNVDEE